MPILAPEDAAAIRAEFEKEMKGEVTVSLVGPSALSPPPQDLTPQIKELLGELAALSPKIKLEYLEAPTPEERSRLGLEAAEWGPITVLAGGARGKVRYLGAPSGHEFPSLIAALIDVSKGDSGLSQKSRDAIARIDRPVHIRVFFTPT
jgi:alkyl hydroperoxide reductase subunit AhpF